MEMEEVDVLSEKIHDQVYVHTYTNGSNDKKLDGLSRLLDAEEQARGILQAAHEEVKIMRSRMKQEVDESIKKFKIELEKYGTSPEILQIKQKYNLQWEQLLEIVKDVMPSRWVETLGI